MVSFFGLIVHLDPTTTLVSFCLLVFALLLFDRTLEKIEHHAEEAKFGELVKKLYKELMIMGFIGFVIFILFNAFTLPHDDNYLAFEFGHITIFFIAIILVFRAIFVVISSNRATAGFWRAHNSSCSLLLERYIAVRRSCWSLESLCFKYLPFWSGLYTDIEYKIMEDFFHSDFNISRYEFSFVDYLTMSNKLYAIEKVELSYVSWFIVIVLAVVNYFRIILTKGRCDSHNDDDHHDDDHHDYDDHDDHSIGMDRRSLSSGDDGADFVVSERCANYNTFYFMFAGCILMLFGAFNCYITWRSKVKLLQIAGNDDNYNYEDILTDVMTREQDTFLALAQKHEELENRKVGRNSAKRSQKTKATVDNLIKASSARHLAEEAGSWHVVSLRKVIEGQKKRNEELQEERREKMKHNFYKVLKWLKIEKCWNAITNQTDTSNKHDDLKRILQLSKKRRSLSHRSLQLESSSRPAARRFSLPGAPPAAPGGTPLAPMPSADSKDNDKQKDKNETKGVRKDEIHPLMFELDSIFILESRYLYNTLLDIFQLLSALYLSLYLTNFLFIAFETEHSAWNTLFSAVCIVILLIIMSFTQFHSNVLFSVTSLQNEAAEWICEQDEIKNNTLPKLREELMNILDKDHFVQEIQDLYNLVNENGDDGIDFKEFQCLLFTLNIHLTHEEVQCLFRVLNITGT